MTESQEFKKIYAEHHPLIHRYLTRMVGPAEAEDLAQEVMVKVSRSLPDFRGQSKLSTWIYRIATNTALDHLRSPAHRELKHHTIAHAPSAPTPALEVEVADKRPSVERLLIRREMHQCIRDFIAGLPPEQRTVLVLSELEEMKNAEIAEILGLTLDTVKIRLHRARARLKAEFEANCNFYHDERNVLSCDLKGALKNLRETT